MNEEVEYEKVEEEEEEKEQVTDNANGAGDETKVEDQDEKKKMLNFLPCWYGSEVYIVGIPMMLRGTWTFFVDLQVSSISIKSNFIKCLL